ncbi:MAG: hypothetical protein ACNA8H_01080 [Anaerolineales bacterium]
MQLCPSVFISPPPCPPPASQGEESEASLQPKYQVLEPLSACPLALSGVCEMGEGRGEGVITPPVK